MLEHQPTAVVLGIAQGVRSGHKHKAGAFDLTHLVGFVYAMERADVASTRARRSAIVDNPINSARLERIQHRGIDLRGVIPFSNQVMVIHIADDGVEGAGWHGKDVARIGERLYKFDYRAADPRLFEPPLPGILRRHLAVL